MSMKGLPNVLDIRQEGLTMGLDLAPRAEGPGRRGLEALERAFHEFDLSMRAVGDTLALSPPLIVSEAQIDEIFDKLGRIIRAVA
jgi:beta-alanine--pyruvate transaminase